MRLLLLLSASLLLAAEPPAGKPDYLKNQLKDDPVSKSKSVLPPPQLKPGETPEPALPSVTEMSVKPTSQGVLAPQGKARKEPPVHGEVTTASGPRGQGAAGTAVFQDTKRGKWAVTTSVGKTKTNPR